MGTSKDQAVLGGGELRAGDARAARVVGIDEDLQVVGVVEVVRSEEGVALEQPRLLPRGSGSEQGFF